MRTGFYQIKEINGLIATCYFDVIDAGNILYCQRFATGASGQRINIGNQYTLRELASDWIKIA